jgi:hypothetical protein
MYKHNPFRIEPCSREARWFSRYFFGALVVIAFSMNAQQASAYTYLRRCGSVPARWASNVYQTSVHSNLSGDWRSVVAYAISAWDNNPSNLGYRASYGDTNVGLGNGQSEMWFTTDPGADAITYTWLDTNRCAYTEADTMFKVAPSYPWTNSTNKTAFFSYGGSYRPFQATAIHELGHAGGLNHTNNGYSVMGVDYTFLSTNGSTSVGYVGADASAGMVSLYGLWANGPDDLAVSHWRWSGTATGEYGVNCRTRVFNSSGAILPIVGGKNCDGAEPVYLVSRGQTVQVEFTYENLGRNARTFSVGYYVSSDSTINTNDLYLAYSNITLAREASWTAATRLVIPTNLARGYYYLGAVADNNGAIGERLENNNASYVEIFVQ